MDKDRAYNCCQSVFCKFSEKYNIREGDAYRIGAFFNAGMRCGGVCGAVSGTLMVLGLEFGDENWHDCLKSIEFQRAFKEKYGSLECKELIKRIGRKDCPTYIKFAQDYLTDILE